MVAHRRLVKATTQRPHARGGRQSIRVIGCVVVGLHRILLAKNALCVHLSGTARGQNTVMDSTLFSSLLFWEQIYPRVWQVAF